MNGVIDKKMQEMNTIRPGDVYKYNCGNDQGYGYMIPVKTSKGWDFIDTYQLGIPLRRGEGETGADASIRQIIELGCTEHDGYVRHATSSFYYHNVHYTRNEVPYNLHLIFNLNDYKVMSNRECDDYDDKDVVKFVPLYFEQNYSWHFGKTFGLCFVRKNAEKSPVNEFKSLLSEVSGSVTEPSAWMRQTGSVAPLRTMCPNCPWYEPKCCNDGNSWTRKHMQDENDKLIVNCFIQR